MASPSSRSSVHFIPVVLLIIAIAGANCDIVVVNEAQHYYAVTGITTPGIGEIPPGLEVTFPIAAAISQSDIPPTPQVYYFEAYTTNPNPAANITGVKEFFATLWVYNNGTVTLFEVNATTPNATTGRLGFTVGY